MKFQNHFHRVSSYFERSDQEIAMGIRFSLRSNRQTISSMERSEDKENHKSPVSDSLGKKQRQVSKEKALRVSSSFKKKSGGSDKSYAKSNNREAHIAKKHSLVQNLDEKGEGIDRGLMKQSFPLECGKGEAIQRPSHKQSPNFQSIWFPFKSSFRRPLLFDANVASTKEGTNDEVEGMSSNSGESLAVQLPSPEPFFSDKTAMDLCPLATSPIRLDLPSLDAGVITSPSSEDAAGMPLLSRDFFQTSKMSRRSQQRKHHRRTIHKKPKQASSPPSQASASHSITELRTRDLSPPPTVRTIHGKKVTIIDEELKIFVVDLLSPETCDLVRNMTDAHVQQVNESGNRVPTWRTLYTYTKQDLPCGEVKNLTSQVTDGIMSSIRDIVGEIFQNPSEAAKLRPRSWKGKS